MSRRSDDRAWTRVELPGTDPGTSDGSCTIPLGPRGGGARWIAAFGIATARLARAETVRLAVGGRGGAALLDVGAAPEARSAELVETLARALRAEPFGPLTLDDGPGARLGVRRDDAPLEGADVVLDLCGEAAALDVAGAAMSPASAARLADAVALAYEALGDPSARPATAPLVRAPARDALLAWAEGPRPPVEEGAAHLAFAARAAASPSQVSLTQGERSLTYGELRASALAIAARLRREGVVPGDRVGVCMARSPEMVASLLGVWMAGAAYVPIDPSHPLARRGYILSDAGAALLLTDAGADLAALFAGPTIAVPDILGSAPDDLDGLPRSGPLAYVMYTSGSTGQPKGVRIPHTAVRNFVDAMVAQFALGPADTTLAVTTISFDISVLELFATLHAGARIVLAREDEVTDGTALARLLVEAGPITLLQATPTTWRLLLGAGWEGTPGLRALCGGEPFPRELARALRGRVDEVWNMYGPTETTVWSTAHRISAEDLERPGGISIGRPIAHTQVYVLDPSRELVPVRARGELYLGGRGLALGYHERDALTEAAFVASPFAPGERLYRTGDLVAWQEDGTLECLGRVDHQVKLRGYRIELGEIEAALERHPSVRQCATRVEPTPGGADALVAYLTARGALSHRALRAHLADALPAYMIPSRYRVVEALPLSPSGKIDRKALTGVPATALEDDEELTAPRTPTETWVAERWSELLGLPRVGATTDFFASGGDSLSAMRFAHLAQVAHGAVVPLSTLFRTRTVEAVARVIDEGTRPGGAARIPRTDAPRFSTAQRALLLHQELVPESVAYNLAYEIGLEGALEVGALERALADLLERHEVLRTGVDASGEAPRVFGVDSVRLGPVEDLGALPIAERLDAARRRAVALARAPFHLRDEPPVRVALLRVGARRHRLVLVAHHVAFDGPSVGLALAELAALYRHHALGAPAPAPLPCGYADAVAFQEHAAAARQEALLAAWEERLAGAPLLELPTDRPRTGGRLAHGGSVSITLDPDATAAVRRLAERLSTTTFMTLLTAFEVLLARYGGQDDLIVSTPFSLRSHPDAQGLLGYFVHTLPTRVRLDETTSFTALARDVQAAVLDAFEGRDAPLEAVSARALGGDGAATLRAAFALGADASGAWDVPGLRAEVHEIPTGAARAELGLMLSEGRDIIHGHLEYDADVYDAARIEAAARHFATLLRSAARDPDASVWRLSMLTDEELDALDRWNATEMVVDDAPTAHAIFEAHARARPDAIALRFEGMEKTYAELDASAARLAGRLAARGVGPGTLVGLALDRGFGLVEGILGVWKAGGAYVPLDPAYPAARLRLVIEDSRLSRVVVDGGMPAALDGVEGLSVVDVREPDPSAAPLASPAIDADTLAYVIYTSGSTGRPKGVELTHRGLVNLVASQRALLDLAPRDRVLQFASPNFDASVWEVVMALMAAGGALVLAPREVLTDTGALARLMNDEGVTVATLPPVVLSAMDPSTCRVERIVSAGEACTLELVRRWAPGRTFINAYGPTETTVCATLQAVSPERQRPPAIGRPLPNLRTYVLGRGDVPVPLGVPGELCVGSDVALARGYLGQPDLTREKFVPDPLRPGGRMYRTGDLAAWLDDGTLDYLGRRDRQIKLRGHRIELDEIEHALASQPGVVRSAIVVIRQPGAVDLLVGFVEPGPDGFDEDGALASLRGQLPAVMVPARLLVREALPITPNGKIDRKALEASRPEELGADAPAEAFDDPLEAQLAELFASALGAGGLRAEDSFFDRGGHSLMATHLAVRIHEATGVRVPIARFFEQPTIRATAAWIRAAREGEALAREEAVDLAAEARLDEAIRPSGAPRPPEAWETVLLTGATGFLGAYLLAALLERPSLRVVCLVRAARDDEARARVLENLARYGLARPGHEERVEVVRGDLGAPRLGLDEARCARLAERVDAILHNGAYVNHVRSYATLAPANVRGTEAVLRLACTGRPKRVLYVSTVDAVPPAGLSEGVARETRADDWHGLPTGYAQSKWVAEGLVLAAAARGLSAAIVRPAAICGSATGGEWNVGDFFTRLLDTCVQLGVVPDWGMRIQVTPVDEVAGWVGDLLRAPAREGGALYHVTQADTIGSADLAAAMREAGHHVALVPYASWRAEVLASARRGEDHPLVPMLGLFEEEGDWDAAVTYANERALADAPRAGFAEPRATLSAFLSRHRGGAGALGLSPAVLPYFEALVAEPLREPAVLRQALVDWVRPVTEAAATYPRLNVSLAWRLQHSALGLVEVLERGQADERSARWIQAAIEYLVRDDDAAHDFEDPDGLLDDLEVVNHVAGALGRADLLVHA
ncbi:MAG: amino acid adenylation domain-containing protein [Sandaracinaceae bacterium]|nr:amino acid adenylation domain-containing protein [Sandaracinaceae bacterium]